MPRPSHSCSALPFDNFLNVLLCRESFGGALEQKKIFALKVPSKCQLFSSRVKGSQLDTVNILFGYDHENVYYRQGRT